MTVKAELTTLLGEIHNSISESDAIPINWNRPSRKYIDRTYPKLVDRIGPEPLTNLFSTFNNEKSVRCDTLALNLQDLLNRICGHTVLIKTLPRVPLSIKGMQPIRFPAVTFNRHFACLDTNSGVVYDPNLIPEPVQLDGSRGFALYQKQAFADSPFLLKTTVLQ